jgi:hypothetical protein
MALPLALLGQLASIAIPVGQSYLASRRQDKYNKRVKDATHHSNLVNLLSRGRVNSRPNVDIPKPSFLEKGLGAANVGLQAWTAIDSANAARRKASQRNTLFDQRTRLNELDLATGERTADQAQGVDAFYAGKTNDDISGFNPVQRSAFLKALNASQTKLFEADQEQNFAEAAHYTKTKNDQRLFDLNKRNIDSQVASRAAQNTRAQDTAKLNELNINSQIASRTSQDTSRAAQAALAQDKFDFKKAVPPVPRMTTTQRTAINAQKQTLDAIESILNIATHAPNLVGPVDGWRPNLTFNDLDKELRAEIRKKISVLQLSAGNDLIKGTLTTPQEEQVAELIGSLKDFQGNFMNGMTALHSMFVNSFRQAGIGFDMSALDVLRKPSDAEIRLMVRTAMSADSSDTRALTWLKRYAPRTVTGAP